MDSVSHRLQDGDQVIAAPGPPAGTATGEGSPRRPFVGAGTVTAARVGRAGGDGQGGQGEGDSYSTEWQYLAILRS